MVVCGDYQQKTLLSTSWLRTIGWYKYKQNLTGIKKSSFPYRWKQGILSSLTADSFTRASRISQTNRDMPILGTCLMLPNQSGKTTTGFPSGSFPSIIDTYIHSSNTLYIYQLFPLPTTFLLYSNSMVAPTSQAHVRSTPNRTSQCT